jgi:hypothetical protein
VSEEKSAKVVQFSCNNPILLHRLAEDVKRSSFASRPKYITALLEALLSFDAAAIKSSCLDDLIDLMRLFKSLPVARIQRLAVLQNRNFDQMLRHLIDVALSHYPEDVSSVDDPDILSHSKFQLAEMADELSVEK